MGSLDGRRIAFEAIQAEHSLVALDGVLRQRLRADIARKLNVPWEPEVVRWLFDEQQVPPEQRPLSRLITAKLNQSCWSGKIGRQRPLAAKPSNKQRSDLGWSWDMTGWIAERQGRYDEAIRCYLASLQTSSLSDQSIRFRTHWFPEPFGRFAAYRLWQLRDHLSAHQRPDALLQCYWSSSPGLRQRVYEYWITQADLAAEQGSPAASTMLCTEPAGIWASTT